MKILFVTAWWPSPVHPTHGNFIEKHARLVGRHHDLVVLATVEDSSLPDGRIRLEFNERTRYREVIVYIGRSPSTSLTLALIHRLRGYWKGFHYMVKQGWRPGVIHGHIFQDSGIAAAIVGTVFRRPVVISEHSSVYEEGRPISGWRTLLVRWAAKRAAIVLPVSQALEVALKNRFHAGPSYRVVPNVVDTELFHPPTAGRERTGYRLLHISTFEPRVKNIPGLLRAFSNLHARDQRFTLHIAGDGDLESVRRMMGELAVPQQAIELTGPHTEREVADLMRSHDVFVLFSHFETQGIVLLEAMATGMPVVATRVGGIPEIVEAGKSGFLIPARNENALVDAIIRAQANYQDFDSMAIRATVTNRFSEAAVLEAFDRVYADITR